MNKKRRTRKEKEIAILRRRANQVEQSPTSLVEKPQYRLSDTKAIHVPIYQSTSSKMNYTYVISDARNTLFITIVLLGLQIITYIFIQKNILHIPQFGF